MSALQPNEPGHVDLLTGRLCVTAIDAFGRPDPDTPLFLHLPDSPVVEWIELEGIDPECEDNPATVDLWTWAGSCLEARPASTPVYLGRVESAEHLAALAKATGNAA